MSRNQTSLQTPARHAGPLLGPLCLQPCPLTHMRGECCSLHMCPASRPASTLWVPKHISHCLHLSKSYLYSQDTSQISFQMSNNGVIFKKYKSDRVIFVLKSFNGSDCTSNTTWGPCTPDPQLRRPLLHWLRPQHWPSGVRSPGQLAHPGAIAGPLTGGFPCSPQAQLCLNSQV